MPKREKRTLSNAGTKCRRRIIGIVFGVALMACALFSALSSEAIPGLLGISAPAREPSSAKTRFPIRFNNGKTVRVRLALTEIERTRGLMGCRELDKDEGMLFVYPTSDQRAFWMKNVPIDLDIGYFNPAGKLLEVYTMRAHDTVSVYSQSDDICFCLEMNRNWFEENGMLPDDRLSLDLDSLNAALRERGFASRQTP